MGNVSRKQSNAIITYAFSQQDMQHAHCKHVALHLQQMPTLAVYFNMISDLVTCLGWISHKGITTTEDCMFDLLHAGS